MSDESGNTVEVWKTIAEFPEYSVSNVGRVRRDVSTKGHAAGIILKPAPRTDGYVRVTLCIKGDRKHRYVARLVAQAFLEPDTNPERDEVNHKNGIKADCSKGNLEWSTRSENIKHSYDVLGQKPCRGEANGNSKLTTETVIRIRKLLAQDVPQVAIALYVEASRWAVNEIATGKTWRHVA